MELRLLGQTLKSNWITKLLQEKVFAISLALAVLTSFAAVPKLNYIDFKVIFCLFNLMAVVCAFEELRIMDKAAVSILVRCGNLRLISLVLLSLTFFSSMLVTNDVALITFVPLTLIISRKISIDPVNIIIFQTLAANIGSSLTPMGNPQNLFLFAHFDLTAVQFFKVMLPYVILGALWLWFMNYKVQKRSFSLVLDSVSVKNRKQALLFGILFAVIILSIFNLVSYMLASILTVTMVLLLDRHLIKKIDYFLLATFVCFFIFIGNLSHIEFVNKTLSSLLDSSSKTFFTSIVLSQFVSNVPASILVANFTTNWKEVLLGVNIGGMGTLIASLASVISYKLYVNEAGSGSSLSYLIKFTLYNLFGLLLFTAINLMFLHLGILK